MILMKLEKESLFNENINIIILVFIYSNKGASIMNKKQICIIITLAVISFIGGYFTKQATMSKSEYFPQARLAREQQAAKTLETLQKLMDAENTPEEEKQKSYEVYRKIAVRVEGETRAELKLKGIGFEDAICFIEDNKVRVIVKSNKSLKENQVKQIRDTVMSQTKLKDVEIRTQK